jgi:hypothetical protein
MPYRPLKPGESFSHDFQGGVLQHQLIEPGIETLDMSNL